MLILFSLWLDLILTINCTVYTSIIQLVLSSRYSTVTDIKVDD